MGQTYYLDTAIFSRKDLADMAEDLVNKAIDEFEKIEERKWYQKLLSGLSIGNADKKVALEQIRDHSELLKIFMMLYNMNAGLLDEQFDSLVNKLISDNEQAKNFYEVTRLQLEREYYMPGDLSNCDQAIILNILGDFFDIYKQNTKSDLEDIQNYNKQVAFSTTVNYSGCALTLEQIDELKNDSAETAYRCVVEQRVMARVSDYPEEIQTYLDCLNISPKRKKDIETQVMKEVERFGRSTLINKYEKEADIINLELFASEINTEEEKTDSVTKDLSYDGVYIIRNAKNEERYLQGGYKSSHVRVAEKNDSDLQRWMIEKHENSGYKIKNVATGKYLYVAIALWGVIPVLETPWKKSTGQFWRITENEDGTVCFRTRLNNSVTNGSAIGVVDKLDGVTLGVDHILGSAKYLGARWYLIKDE